MCFIVWHTCAARITRFVCVFARIALISATPLLISGCTTATTTRNSATQASLSGLAAADAALGAYDALRDVASDNAYYQGYLRIVVSSEPDKVDFTHVSDADMSHLIDQRVAVFRQFRNAYVLFQHLCAGDAASDNSADQSYASLFETLKGLSKDEAVSSETKKTVAELPSDFTALLMARKIRSIQAILRKLTTEMGVLWNRDLPVWNSYIDAVYIEHYASALTSLQLANFDEKDLAKAVTDPYPAPVKAGLYKLQKYREACLKADRLKNELRQVAKAFLQVDDHLRLLSATAVPPNTFPDSQNATVRTVTLAQQPRKE